MNADKTKKKLLEKAQKEFASLLDSYKQGNLDKSPGKFDRETVAFLIASALGRCRRFDAEETIVLPDPKILAERAFSSLKKMDIVEQYRKIEKEFSGSDQPMPYEDAIRFLDSRDAAQLAWLAIRDVLDPPIEKNLAIHRGRFELVQSWMEAEDDFFDRLAWIFFEAVPWLLEQSKHFSKSADMAHFPWFWMIPRAAIQAWDMPIIIPEHFKDSKETQPALSDELYDFDFVREAFGKGLAPPIKNPTHEQILERLSISQLAAKAPLSTEEQSRTLQSQMESFIQLLEPIRIRPRRGLPGFIITLSRTPAIDFSFQDAQCCPYKEFEGAMLVLGDKEAKIENGFASITYDQIRSLYEDLSRLDERLVIRFSDGTEKTRFTPDPS